MSSLSGPKKTIFLDGDELDGTKITSDAVVMWKNRRWVKEVVGCALCADDPGSVTLSDTENDSACHCSVHGELIEYPYVYKRTWQIKIADKEMAGEVYDEDSVLLPVSYSDKDREALLDEYLAALAKAEEDDDDEEYDD